MPQTTVYFYQEADGRSPVVEWLQEVAARDRRALSNCLARLQLLAQLGHELRRPHADYLRDGILELRAKQGHVQYRMLYFFEGKDVVVVAHGLTKENSVPKNDIQRAIERRERYEQAPQKHRSIISIPRSADF